MKGRTVKIEVREARDLPAADSNGLSDPFFWVFFNNQHRKESAVVYKTLAPKWEQSFEFEIEDIKLDFVTVVVWDKDPIGKDFLGFGLLPLVLSEHKRDPVDVWVPLKPRLELVDSKKATLKQAKHYLNAAGGRGEIRLVISLGEPVKGRPSLDSASSSANMASRASGVAHNASSADREALTRTVLDNFRSLAVSTTENVTWQIPTGDVELQNMLAEGTNAVVYRGRYRGQPVAIKVLKQALDPVQMRDFTQEFQMLSSLRSPFAVLFYGASIDDVSNKLSMVFEFCSNGSLQGVMKRADVVWDWDRFFRCSIQAVLGVASLHNWKPPVLHRDVKSLNFLVDAFWNIKVADLGLARTQEDTNDATLKTLRGTFHYSPPEVYSKEESFTDKSDVFSLAVCLWEMATRVLTGDYFVPYHDQGFKFDFQIIIKVSKEGLRPNIPPSCPEELKALIVMCWDKEKDKRLTSTLLAEALQKLYEYYKTEKKKEWDAVVVAKTPTP